MAFFSSEQARTAGVRARSWRLIAGIMLLSLLTGCAGDRLRLTQNEKQQRWHSTRQQLLQIKDWQLSGRLGLKIPGRSGSLSVDWKQTADRFALQLDGPFGQPLARVSGDRRAVQAHIAGESQVITEATPEELMAHITGWKLPVSYLRYWVLGVPVPALKSKVSLDENGSPKVLYQGSWKVTYLAFRQDSGIRLPRRLQVSRDGIRLALTVSRWQIGPMTPDWQKAVLE